MTRFKARPIRTAFIVTAITSCLSGCAYSYVDEDGNRHIIGLVSLKLTPTGGSQTLAGDVADITTVGISIADTAQGAHFTIGYSRDVVAALKNDAAVMGNPLAALLAAGSSPQALEGDARK